MSLRPMSLRPMSRLRPFVVTAFAAWTFGVWVGRLGLAWSDKTLSTGGKIGATVPVAIFTVLGAAVAAAVLRVDDDDLGTSGRRVVQVAAIWTIGYWVVRLPLIVTDSHAVGFKAVHTVLAAVSWGLAGAALRAVRAHHSQTQHPTPVAA